MVECALPCSLLGIDDNELPGIAAQLVAIPEAFIVSEPVGNDPILSRRLVFALVRRPVPAGNPEGTL
jgi:hypothetical protein